MSQYNALDAVKESGGNLGSVTARRINVDLNDAAK